jgi:glucan 1,3-beta-glucosidase
MQIGPDINGVIQTPLWSYKLGLDNGWMPTDPRTANGTCASYNVNLPRFDPASFAPSQTGAGNGQVDPTALAKFGQWPPPTISGLPDTVPITAAPVYTPTGSPVTLAMPTITDSRGHTASLSADGWANQADTALRYVPVADCAYPDPWTGGLTQTAVCTGTATATLGAATTPVGSIVTPAPTSTAARRR